MLAGQPHRPPQRRRGGALGATAAAAAAGWRSVKADDAPHQCLPHHWPAVCGELLFFGGVLHRAWVARRSASQPPPHAHLPNARLLAPPPLLLLRVRPQGLKCVYPPEGGLGSVELTHLDLTRLGERARVWRASPPASPSPSHRLPARLTSPTRPPTLPCPAAHPAPADDTEFLNDTIIDYYLRLLQARMEPDQLLRCHFFSSFFYKKLTEKSGEPRGAGWGACTPGAWPAGTA